MRKVLFFGDAIRFYWKNNNQKIANKIKSLIYDIQEHQFEVLGKPEPLKGDFTGYWSKRITKEHRLVYRVTDDEIRIIQCMNHY